MNTKDNGKEPHSLGDKDIRQGGKPVGKQLRDEPTTTANSDLVDSSTTNPCDNTSATTPTRTTADHPFLASHVPRYRPDGSVSNAYRSIEHVLQSTSCRTNRHLRRLTRCMRTAPPVPAARQSVQQEEQWAQRFLKLVLFDERFARIACHGSKGLKKELVEGVSMMERVEAMVEQLATTKSTGSDDPADTNATDDAIRSGQGLILLDLCAGKGIATVMLALRFPEARVVGLDLRPPSDAERYLHDGVLSNLTRVTGNLHDEALLRQIITTEQQIKMPSVDSRRRCILLGTHLCGDLARCALDLTGRYPDHIVAAVVVPCCLQRQKRSTGKAKYSGKDWGYDTTRVARQRGVDPFALWLDRLWRRAPVSARNKFLWRDDDMLSSKNEYLLLCRGGFGEDHDTAAVVDENAGNDSSSKWLVCRQVAADCTEEMETLTVS